MAPRFLQGAELAELDRVVLAEATAIPKIAAVYARTPIATLKAWQAFHLVDAVAPYLSKRFDANGQALAYVYFEDRGSRDGGPLS